MRTLDLIRLNETFGARVLACMPERKFEPDELVAMSVNDFDMSPSYPADAGRFSLKAMCIGGGRGLEALSATVG